MMETTERQNLLLHVIEKTSPTNLDKFESIIYLLQQEFPGAFPDYKFDGNFLRPTDETLRNDIYTLANQRFVDIS